MERQELKCERQKSLLGNNTMGFNIVAKKYYEINALKDIDELIENNVFDDEKILILGGGSNILFKDEYFDGTIIHSNLKGISIDVDDDDIETQRLGDSETQGLITDRCMSSEIWKDFVDFTVKNKLYGLENIVYKKIKYC